MMEKPQFLRSDEEVPVHGYDSRLTPAYHGHSWPLLATFQRLNCLSWLANTFFIDPVSSTDQEGASDGIENGDQTAVISFNCCDLVEWEPIEKRTL